MEEKFKLTGEDIMYTILNNKDAKYILQINGQLHIHLTPTECVDIMEQAISQFDILCDNVRQTMLDLTSYGKQFAMVYTADNGRLSIRGRME